MADYIGRETTIEVGGKSYTLTRYDRAVLDKMTEWARARLPSPLAAIKDHLADLPRHLQDTAIKAAVEMGGRKLSFDSPLIQEQMTTMDGGVKILSLLLAKHHPDLTEDKVVELVEALAEERGDGFEAYLSEKLGECQGRFPKGRK